MHAARNVRVLRFGVFELDLAGAELRKNGMRVRLQDQPFQALVMLVSRPGELVTREELQRALWPANTYVDFQHGLDKAINKLRLALNDARISPRFIETVPRRGYRFIAPVHGESTQPSFRSAKLRLAVLPFRNIGGLDSDDYFCDGLTEEMIARIGQINPSLLGVIARTSSMQYRHSHKSVSEIGAELGVPVVLEGSVARDGNRVRINATLVDVAAQTQIWSDSFVSPIEDIFRLQQEVAGRIGQALRIELLASFARRSAAATTRPEALEAYLRGRHHWNQRTEPALHAALQSFHEAIALDPGCARAYCGVADSSLMLTWFGALRPHRSAPAARAAADKALALDAELGEAYCSSALVRFWYEWDWDAAEREFERAIALSPNYAIAHHWYGAYMLAAGRLDRAAREFAAARDLDPLSLMTAKCVGDPLLYARDYEGAIDHFAPIVAKEPRFAPAHFDLGRAHLYAGDYADATASFEHAFEVSGNAGALPALACAHARKGDVEQAGRILRQVLNARAEKYVAATPIAAVYESLGDLDSAFAWLETAVAERCFWLVFLNVDPIYDGLRGDVRFAALLKRIGFARRDSDQVAPETDRTVLEMHKAAATR